MNPPERLMQVRSGRAVSREGGDVTDLTVITTNS